MKNSTNDSFAQDTANGLVLVDFYADWCGPCQMIAPVLEELANGGLNVVKVNVDVTNIAETFNVRGIPTLVLMKDGKEVSRKVGNQPKATLIQWVETNKQ